MFCVCKVVLILSLPYKNNLSWGSGCGSVGRAVASDTKDPQFKSRHRQTFTKHLFTVHCVEKTKIKKKRPGMAHFLKNDTSFHFSCSAFIMKTNYVSMVLIFNNSTAKKLRQKLYSCYLLHRWERDSN